jgi:murein DD-endopeptidase MepM/ murein hydrolase activator NlpD
VRIKPPRPLLIATTAALVSLLGVPAVTAQVVTVTTTSTTTVIAAVPATTTTQAPTTTIAATTPPTTGAETRILPVPQGGTRIVDPSASSTTKAGDAGSTTTVPPASLSPGQVDAVLRDQQRSGASSTAGLIEALRPLQNLGMTTQEALALGMGQFPVLGLANWTDDWLDFREGPPVHQHQGTDVFSAFDTPVRAPVDGVVRFEDAGLGGKGAYVTAPDGTYYYMAHLNSFSAELRNGMAVKQGQVVGFNGDSGNAKGGAPHVHFEVHPGGGAAVNAKPFLDAWLNAALARVPEILASFQVKAADGTPAEDGGVPQILVATGLTRRFSSPSQPVPTREPRTGDFNHAVLGPLTPTALAPLLDPTRAD